MRSIHVAAFSKFLIHVQCSVIKGFEMRLVHCILRLNEVKVKTKSNCVYLD